MTKQVRKYTQEFKQEAVNLALKSPSISSTATELGIPVGTLHTWVQQFKATTPSPAKLADRDKPNVAALLEENRRLHKELTRVREEKDILKKAAAYFAQHLR
jgi:transposase